MICPSVTQVLSPYCDFSRIPPKVLEAASIRGTAVHDICLLRIARGEFAVGIDPDHQGYVDSFCQWFDKVVDTVIVTEERLIDMVFSYHGQIDALVQSKHDDILLVDLKTPPIKAKQWNIQMSAYKHLVEISEYPNPDRVGSLRLSPDGKTPKMDFYERHIEDFNIFLSALNCYRYFNS
jgi:hypothetical protein